MNRVSAAFRSTTHQSPSILPAALVARIGQNHFPVASSYDEIDCAGECAPWLGHTCCLPLVRAGFFLELLTIHFCTLLQESWTDNRVIFFKHNQIGFAGETRRSELRRIPPPKSKRVRRTRIPTTSLVTARSALSLGLVMGSPALTNKRFEMRSEDASAKRDPLKEACLARGVWVNS